MPDPLILPHSGARLALVPIHDRGDVRLNTGGMVFEQFENGVASFLSPSGKSGVAYTAPYAPGEVVPVAEAWGILLPIGPTEIPTAPTVLFQADYPNGISDRHDYGLIDWQPGSTMPVWAARRHVRIVSVEPRRLCAFSETEIELMGIKPDNDYGLRMWWEKSHGSPWMEAWVWAVRISEGSK